MVGTTLNVARRRQKPDICRTLESAWRLGRVDFGSVDQHNRDVILDGVDAAALAAFEAVTVGAEDDRLFADRTNEDFEEILGNHGGIIVQGAAVRLRGISAGRGPMR